MRYSLLLLVAGCTQSLAPSDVECVEYGAVVTDTIGIFAIAGRDTLWSVRQAAPCVVAREKATGDLWDRVITAQGDTVWRER